METNKRPNASATVTTAPAAVKVQETLGKINDLLRHADGMLKRGEAESALVLTREARQLDPTHAYGEAMEKRIEEWMRERDQRASAEAAARAAAEARANAAAKAAMTPPSPPQREKKVPIEVPAPAPATSDNQTGAGKGRSKSPGLIRTQSANRPKILLIDDDDLLRTALSESIDEGGFEAIGVGTGEEALTLLQKLTPDLILCDVNLETSAFGGFSLFEAIQRLKHLKSVPFIFLTGMHDEVLVRTGKELGADDYLTKPISESDLLAVIRGKLKRYSRLSD